MVNKKKRRKRWLKNRVKRTQRSVFAKEFREHFVRKGILKSGEING